MLATYVGFGSLIEGNAVGRTMRVARRNPETEHGCLSEQRGGDTAHAGVGAEVPREVAHRDDDCDLRALADPPKPL
jgi:hypothetical protein